MFYFKFNHVHLSFSERSIAFLYLPSTERNYIANGGIDESDPTYEEDANDRIESSTSKTSSISSSSSSSSTTTRRGSKHDTVVNTGEKRHNHGVGNEGRSNRGNAPTQRATASSSPPSSYSTGSPSRDKGSKKHGSDYDSRNNDDLVDSSSENNSQTKVVTSKTVSTSSTRDVAGDQCVPMNVDFCVNITGASKQNVMDELTLLQLATVVDSQCYPFAAHFLCSWGIACKHDELTDHDGRPLLLCKDYCDEFMTNCGHKLSNSMKEKITCGGEWKGPNSCITKPGCVAELYNTGQKRRICDGVNIKNTSIFSLI